MAVRLNSVGSALVATSGGPVSIDGAVPAALAAVTAAGAWHWLDDDTAVGLGSSGGPVSLRQYVVSTLTLTVLDAAVSSASVAGGGTWAVYAAATGVSTSIAGLGPLAAAGVLDAGADGGLALVLNLASLRGIRVYDVAGVELATLDSVLTSLEARLRAGRLTYLDDAGWHVYKLSTRTFDTIAQRSTVPTLTVPVLLTGGTVVLVEVTATQVTVRQAVAALGYQVAGVVYGLDAIEVSAGVVRIAYTTAAASLAAQLVVKDINVANATVVTGTVVTGAIVYGAAVAVAAGPIPAATSSIDVNLDALLRQRLVDTRALVAREWVPWFAAVDELVSGPVDFARGVTGVLEQGNGGTGNQVGATVNGFGLVTVGATAVAAQVPGDNLTVTAGVGITLTPVAAARSVAIAVTTPTTITRKTIAESVTSSAVLQTDDALVTPIAAAAVLALEWVLQIAGGGGDVQLALNVPAGATGTWGVVGLANANAADLTDTGALTIALVGTDPLCYVLRALIVNAGTAGTVALRWAQAVSDPAATTIGAGSHLVATVTP